jgi:hypothetical protein
LTARPDIRGPTDQYLRCIEREVLDPVSRGDASETAPLHEDSALDQVDVGLIVLTLVANGRILTDVNEEFTLLVAYPQVASIGGA